MAGEEIRTFTSNSIKANYQIIVIINRLQPRIQLYVTDRHTYFKFTTLILNTIHMQHKQIPENRRKYIYNRS